MTISSTPIDTASKTLLSGWERALLVLPAVAGLALGLFPLLLPALFAQVAQLPARDFFAYQVAGAGTLGYGVALALGLFQKDWLAVRLPVSATLVFNLASLYACAVRIFSAPNAPYSVYVVLAASLLFVALSGLLLLLHRGTPRPESNLASPPLRVFFMVGAVAAATFGLLPLFVPGLFTLFHLVADPDLSFIARQAGASSLGYAVLSVLALSALNTRELPLVGVMAAVFNGVSAIVSIPYIVSGEVLVLPWIIAPFGVFVVVVCLLVLRKARGIARTGAYGGQGEE
jgi:hypothetical protein